MDTKETKPETTKIPLFKTVHRKKTDDFKTYMYDQKKYNDTHYQKHREEILEKVLCGCGGQYCKVAKSRHIKSKKHLKFENKSV
jgi:hypothetical protein